MSIEIKIDDRIAKVEVIKKSNSKFSVRIDDKIYNLKYSNTEPGVFLLFHNNKFHKFLITDNQTNPKKLIVHTDDKRFEVAIIDQEEKYLLSKNKENINNEENIISFPMPGKVVKILVKEGDKIKIGDTLIIISAMKMESDFKSTINGVVKKINTKVGATIEGGKPLIYLEKK